MNYRPKRDFFYYLVLVAKTYEVSSCLGKTLLMKALGMGAAPLQSAEKNLKVKTENGVRLYWLMLCTVSNR